MQDFRFIVLILIEAIFLISSTQQFETKSFICESPNYLTNTGLELLNGCTLYNSTQFLDYAQVSLTDSFDMESEEECCTLCQSISCDFFLMLTNSSSISCNFYKISASRVFLCPVNSLMVGIPAISNLLK